MREETIGGQRLSLEFDYEPPASTEVVWTVKHIGHQTTRAFVEEWHYSRRIPTGKNINFGLFAGQTLYAVIVYGIGVNPYQSAFLGTPNAVEIKRMCRTEPRLDYPLSKFISVTAKLLQNEVGWTALVAFADPEHGHEGGVYKASGFEYAGLTNAEWHLVGEDGIQRHRRVAFRFARRKSISVSEARLVLGLKRVRTSPKHRWVRYARRQGSRAEKAVRDREFTERGLLPPPTATPDSDAQARLFPE